MISVYVPTASMPTELKITTWSKYKKRSQEWAWKASKTRLDYHAKRHAAGIDALEALAAEVRELARVAAMPSKLVRDGDGRSIGAVKVPKLITRH